MQNFQNAFETLKQSIIRAFSICMTAPLTGFSSKPEDIHKKKIGQFLNHG